MSKAGLLAKFEDRACHECGAKRWQTHKKNLRCEGCGSEFAVIGSELVIVARVKVRNVHGSIRDRARLAARS
jgi:Zn finger protein HypA/HybF involved in hydrogenase expression